MLADVPCLTIDPRHLRRHHRNCVCFTLMNRTSAAPLCGWLVGEENVVALMQLVVFLPPVEPAGIQVCGLRQRASAPAGDPAAFVLAVQVTVNLAVRDPAAAVEQRSPPAGAPVHDLYGVGLAGAPYAFDDQLDTVVNPPHAFQLVAAQPSVLHAGDQVGQPLALVPDQESFARLDRQVAKLQTDYRQGKTEAGELFYHPRVFPVVYQYRHRG